MQLFLGILLLVMAIFLVIAVLMQSGKSKRLSGTIAGGAETFFGKAKGRTIDALLSKITTVVAILFVLVVIIVYIAFGTNYEEYTEPQINNPVIEVTPEDVTPEGEETPDEVTPEGEQTPDEVTPEGEEVPEEVTPDTPADETVEGETETTEE